jgi:hypothetical protein
VEFQSPIGNSDIPYPWARDTNGLIYVLLENTVIEPREPWYSNCPDVYMGGNPYNYYYQAICITPDICTKPPRQPFIRAFQNITAFRIGTERFRMQYKPNAGAEYDRLTNPDDGFPGAFQVKSFGIWRTLCRDEYIELLEEFGRAMGFQPLEIVLVICKRHKKEFSVSTLF